MSRYDLNHIAFRGWGDESGEWLETFCGFVFSADRLLGGESCADCATCRLRYESYKRAVARP